jgi:hypothetical protein
MQMIYPMEFIFNLNGANSGDKIRRLVSRKARERQQKAVHLGNWAER